MLRQLRDRVTRLFSSPSETPVPITENSRVEEILALYPGMRRYLASRFGVSLAASNGRLTLAELCKSYALPPAQIVYMEIQLDARALTVAQLTPGEAKAFLNQGAKLLDVREPWEWKLTEIAGSIRLTPEVFAELSREAKRDTPLLFYCHFGIRSLDAAAEFSARGFTNVAMIKGGIDAWATQIDPSLPKYEGAWC